jgi:hypothetical protein
MSQLPSSGGFRVLWLGNPALLPVDAKVVDGIGFGLTRDGPGDARALWAAPQNSADDMLADAIAAVRAGDTARLGHLVAPIGVRYVAVINRLAPGQGPTVPADPKLADAVSRQLDLSVSRIDEGGVIYSNDAWIPRRASVPASTPLAPGASGPAAGLALAARSNPAVVAHGVNGPLNNSDPTGPGSLLWAEAADPGWHATAGGSGLSRSLAFNWTNAFALPAHESVGLHYHAGWLPRLLIWFEIVVWILALVAWRRTRMRRSRRPVTT